MYEHYYVEIDVEKHQKHLNLIFILNFKSKVPYLTKTKASLLR